MTLKRVSMPIAQHGITYITTPDITPSTARWTRWMIPLIIYLSAHVGRPSTRQRRRCSCRLKQLLHGAPAWPMQSAPVVGSRGSALHPPSQRIRPRRSRNQTAHRPGTPPATSPDRIFHQLGKPLLDHAIPPPLRSASRRGFACFALTCPCSQYTAEGTTARFRIPSCYLPDKDLLL